MNYEQAAAPQSPTGEEDTSGIVSRWLDEITKCERRRDPYIKACEKITERYRQESVLSQDVNASRNNSYRFNILWSNTQTIAPAIYSRLPKPDIERRFLDNDPVGRVAAQILERTVSFCIQENDFHPMMMANRLDFVLFGIGCSWVRYEPTYDETEPSIDSETGEPAEPEVSYEEALIDYVNYADFYYSDSRMWEEFSWVGRRLFMTRQDMVKRFGPIGEKVPLDHKQKTGNNTSITIDKLSPDSKYNKATIYEIWCKPENKVYWIAKEFKQVLDMGEPHLKFDGFYPCPKPARGTISNDVFEPVPDYLQYRDQASQLDEISRRRAGLIRSLRILGVYDSSIEALGTAFTQGSDNELFPYKNDYAQFLQGGGIAAAIQTVPIDKNASVLQGLNAEFSVIKQDIYEITGISDIIRGSSNPNETATAQEIKGRFGTMRLQDKQTEIQRFARDNIKLLAEIIAENFSGETLLAITGIKLPTRQEVQAKFAQEVQQFQLQLQQYQQQIAQYQQIAAQAQQTGQELPAPPQQPEQPQPSNEVTIDDVVDLLRNDPMRNFRIDIETDSTIATDYEAEKQSRIELATAIGPFLQQMLQVGQAAPELIPFLSETMLFVLKGFKAGRPLEESLQKGLAAIAQNAQEPQQPEPDPMVQIKQEQVKGDLQLKKEKQDGEFALKQQALKDKVALSRNLSSVNQALLGQ